jgi:tripartite-type tricarboxylate transporter receptor subunit TctC
MKLPRRKFLHLAAGAVTLQAVSRIARAQTYPTRPVRLIVGFTPGGPTASFVSAIMSAIGDTTMDSIVREPARAKRYTNAGFDAFWNAVAG